MGFLVGGGEDHSGATGVAGVERSQMPVMRCRSCCGTCGPRHTRRSAGQTVTPTRHPAGSGADFEQWEGELGDIGDALGLFGGLPILMLRTDPRVRGRRRIRR